MNRRPAVWARATVGAAALCILACTDVKDERWVELPATDSTSAAIFRLAGTVRHLQLEGGVFVIQATDGTQYNPSNLPQAFQVDSLPIEADARRRDDMMSIGMVGPIVDLVRIRRQSAPGSKPE